MIQLKPPTLTTYLKLVSQTGRLAVLLLTFLAFLFLGCNDYLTKDVVLAGGKATGASPTPTPSPGESDDSDKDGLSDEVETTFKLDSSSADSDGDGFADGLEFVGSNGDPLDSAKQPQPQNRESSTSTAATATSDSDGDGLSDSFEETQGLSSDNADSDGDGYGDPLELVGASDPLISESRPTRANPPTANGQIGEVSAPTDSDEDGLADNLEELNFTIAQSADTDADGFADGLEYLMGSAGNDPESVPDF